MYVEESVMEAAKNIINKTISVNEFTKMYDKASKMIINGNRLMKKKDYKSAYDEFKKAKDQLTYCIKMADNIEDDSFKTIAKEFIGRIEDDIKNIGYNIPEYNPLGKDYNRKMWKFYAKNMRESVQEDMNICKKHMK